MFVECAADRLLGNVVRRREKALELEFAGSCTNTVSHSCLCGRRRKIYKVKLRGQGFLWRPNTANVGRAVRFFPTKGSTWTIFYQDRYDVHLGAKNYSPSPISTNVEEINDLIGRIIQ